MRFESQSVTEAKCSSSFRCNKNRSPGSSSDEDGRVALHALGSPSYARLASGVGPDGAPITVVAAMRSSRGG